MENPLQDAIHQFISRLDVLIPEYLQNPLDESKSHGNVAVCILDQEGNVYGKVWGTNKISGRQAYKVAWTKASQVWITGFKTGEFEKKVYAGEINEKDFGLTKPDLIGWDGGQPIVLPDAHPISVGFSGFRGSSDLEIVIKAVALL
jgi:uncharacterized protein GlcG (DUF336 family)